MQNRAPTLVKAATTEMVLIKSKEKCTYRVSFLPMPSSSCARFSMELSITEQIVHTIIAALTISRSGCTSSSIFDVTRYLASKIGEIGLEV